MPLDLESFSLYGAQRLRMALLQEMLDHSSDPRVALQVAIEAEGWINGQVQQAADMFTADMLRETVRSILAEMAPTKAQERTLPIPAAAPACELFPVGEPSAEVAPAPDADGTKAEAPDDDLEAWDKAVPPEKRDDDASIRRLSGAGWTYSAIAVQIGKTDGYVRSRAADLGLPPRKSGPVSVKKEPTAKQVEREEAIKTRRSELKRMWEAGVPAGEIAKTLGYAGANSVKATAVNHMGLAPRVPEVSSSDAIAAHIAEKGVMSQPDFGDAEVNCLYPLLRERGHTLKKVSPEVRGPRRFILDDSSFTLTRGELLSRGKDIVAKETSLTAKPGGAS
jgi:hypothetical protein